MILSKKGQPWGKKLAFFVLFLFLFLFHFQKFCGQKMTVDITNARQIEKENVLKIEK